MSMTKQNYELIATTIKKMYSLGDNQMYVADMIAVALAQDNPKFDREKFLKACGVTE